MSIINQWVDELRKYLAIFLISLKQFKSYTMNFIGYMVMLPIDITLNLLLYSVIYSSRSTGVIGGFSLMQAIGYGYLSVLVLSSMLSRSALRTEDDIVQGNLTLYLVKPSNYIFTLFCELLPRNLIFLLFGYLTYLVFFLFFSFPLMVVGVFPYFLIAIVFSYAFSFLFYTCIGLVSFWTGRSFYFRNIMAIIILVFGGGFFPLTWFGTEINSILQLLPFQYIVYVPVALSVGVIDSNNVSNILLLELTWLLFIVVIMWLLWKFGVGRYEAFGG